MIYIQSSLNKQQVLSIDPTINTVFVGSYILFIINIPIYYNDTFTLYKIYSIPSLININQYIFIQANNEYLAISKNTEHYITAWNIQINNCKDTKNFRLCNTINTINFKSRETCEFTQFINPTMVSPICKIKHTFRNKATFINSQYKNTWIY